MFKKGDFKKLDLLGSGKKNTKIYKVIHLQSGKIYVLKEIEAKTLDKLNEYKEEAVQLSKVQTHPNIIKFYGYYFSETMYNTFRLGIVTEYIEHQSNLENLYRKKKKLNQGWKESELVTILFSVISTCSYLQQRGICHRDIKPANLFLQNNGEVKLIDFGESKDYFYDPNDESKNTFTVATIRGTPQYLSPILWKAHCVDGTSRYVEHNIYKSDVFSCGLVLMQLALMNEVTGYNNNTPQNNGEILIKQNLQDLEKIYSSKFLNIIALMLIFEESGRPSFVEIEQLFIEHEKTALESGDPSKKQNDYIHQYNQHYNTMLNKGPQIQFGSQINPLNSINMLSASQKKKPEEQQFLTEKKNSNTNSNNQSTTSYKLLDDKSGKTTANQQGQAKAAKENKEKFGVMYKETTLILHESCLWFEFGGTQIGKFSIHKQRWKISQNPDKQPFPFHFVTVFIPDLKCYYLLGGQMQNNFKIYQGGKMTMAKNQIPTFRNFFPAIFYNQRVWLFGGYDNNTKTQLKSCEYYDILGEKWCSIEDFNMPRSQAAACKVNDNEILLFGGYNKEHGTLDSIERYLIKENKWELLKIKLPLKLRRFMVVRVQKNVLLILGGLSVQSKESQRVFKFIYDKQEFIELESLEKGGVIENEILVDQDDNLHIFIEHANGTSAHSHIKYYYDPKATQYMTKQEP